MKSGKCIDLGRREALIQMGCVALSGLLLPELFLKRHLFSFLPERYPAQIIAIGSGASRILNIVLNQIRRPFRSISFHADPTSYQESLADLKVLKNISRHEVAMCCPHPEVGKVICENDRAKILRMLRQGRANIIITCLGGDFGTGAGPLIAAWSKELCLPTYAIVTLPFVLETPKSHEVADMAVAEFQRQTISTYEFDNNECFRLSRRQSLSNRLDSAYFKAFINQANQELAQRCITTLQNQLASGVQIS